MRTLQWMLWITYALFYTARLALSASKPFAIEDGVSHTTLGWFDAGFLWAYAAGQLINGRLADRFSNTYMIYIGLLLSGLLCAAFPYVAFTWISFCFWVMHGYSQSLGWSPSVRLVRYASGRENLGIRMSIHTTSYQAGAVLGLYLGGLAIGYFGFRGPFVYPIVLFLIITIICFKPLLKSEQVIKLTHQDAPRHKRTEISTRRPILLVGSILLLINMLRYGMLLWLPVLFVDGTDMSPSESSFLAALVAAAGILGTLLIGLMVQMHGIDSSKNKLFGMMGLISLSCIVLYLSSSSTIALILILITVSMLLYACHSLCVALLPTILGPRTRAGTMVGAIDAIGYIGTGLSSLMTGLLIDYGGWDYVFLCWILASLTAMSIGWVVRKERVLLD